MIKNNGLFFHIFIRMGLSQQSECRSGQPNDQLKYLSDSRDVASDMYYISIFMVCSLLLT